MTSESILEEQFLEFVRSAIQQFKNSAQWFFGTGCVSVVLLWRILYYNEKGKFFLVEPYSEIRYYLFSLRLDYFSAVLGLLGELVLAFFIGLLIWRLLVIAWHLWDLGGKFKLIPHLLHPDGRGGLKPIGNLCLLSASISSILGLFLIIWLALGKVKYVQDRYVDMYKSLHESLLIIPVFLAVVTFIVPVWRIHKGLLEEKFKIRREIDKLGSGINENMESLIPGQEILNSVAAEQSSNKLKSFSALYRELYKVIRQYPVWPFNARIIIKFGLSQTPQILALIGLKEPIQNIVKSILEYI